MSLRFLLQPVIFTRHFSIRREGPPVGPPAGPRSSRRVRAGLLAFACFLVTSGSPYPQACAEEGSGDRDPTREGQSVWVFPTELSSSDQTDASGEGESDSGTENEDRILDIELVGVFGDAAAIVLDGRQLLIRVGESATDGITLISVDQDAAVIEVESSRHRLELSRRVSSEFEPVERGAVSILSNADGHFVAIGSINQYPVRMLVDTGATVMAMNLATARRLGVSVDDAERAWTITASGRIEAFRVFLATVQVGDILVRGVETAVFEGEHPREILLGMSFLRHALIREEGGVMTLRRRF